MERATILEVFPRHRKNSLLTQGIAVLGDGRTVEFAGLFAPPEEKYLKKGARIRGHVSQSVLRNAEITR